MTKLTDKQFFIQLGEEISDKIRTRTRKGKDIDGKKFKKLSPSYKKAKKAFKNLVGPKQTSKKVNPTDLQYTGDMLRDLQVRSSSDESVTIGWTGSMATRVYQNEDNGRFMSKTNKPVNNDEQKHIEQRLDARINKSVDKEIDNIIANKKNLHIKL